MNIQNSEQTNPVDAIRARSWSISDENESEFNRAGLMGSTANKNMASGAATGVVESGDY